MASLLTLPALALSNSTSGSGASSAARPRATAFRCWALRPRGWAAAAVASPNSVLSEHAFKRLQLGSDDEDEEGVYGSDGDEGFEAEVGFQGDEEELAISRLGLPDELVATLEKRGITHLFPIQRAVLIPALEGRDLIARAKTGTGKTLAFGIPMIKQLIEEDDGRSVRRGRIPRVLVLAPTRELAKQVEKEIKESAPKLSTVCVYGGVSYNVQQNALSRGVDVVVGTPGRIIDLINGGSLQLGEVKYLVLDEADQMLAVGFEEDVETILQQLPAERQSMLFSATMPSWVKKLSRYLNNPLTIDLVGDQDEKLAEGIKLYAIPLTVTSKRTILSDLITVCLCKGWENHCFHTTKRDADEVSLALTNSIASEALHGDISQHQRERTLNGFRQGKFTVLVATDVAARGLDIPNVDLIIHYELPNDPETFVHRSGRTGRAGKAGTAILMFTSSQKRTVKSLERDWLQEVLESSAEHVIATLRGVDPESTQYFLGAAERLTEELGPHALASALAHLSGFSQPPSSRSLISHEQGWVTLQLTREPGYGRGSSWQIYLTADENVQGAVFDLPEEIAKDLLAMELPAGNTITKISKLPALQDDGPPSDSYGRFSNDRGSRNRRSSRGGSSARGRGGWDSDGEDRFRRGGRSFRSDNDSWSEDDWSGGGRKSNRSSSFGGRSSSYGSRGSPSFGGRSSSFGSRDSSRSFSGACFNCGESGHRASDCPNKRW
ncbi:hypothetical protein BS78_K134400 [Paspalum vaginatum]|uniref:RNA helicase n=1 Tax=Paspalum vaginatum TaxID=158149 RepID=A0A9W7X7V1_9POAL|nr:hypothetical protein BS78_K134400 [Paspalum vaginatum]